MPPAAEFASTPIAEDRAPPSGAALRQINLRQINLCRALEPALLLLPLLAWVAADAAAPTIGFSRNAMQVAVDLQGAQWPTWSLLPVVSLALAAVRGLMGSGPAGAWAATRNVLSWIRPPLLALIGLRLLSLWNPLGSLLPWIGLAWAPHVSIALALTPFLGNRQRPAAARRRTAACLLMMWLVLYGGYALYICQSVMIHGDEAQYLRVTQSLLRDGDIDLANNLAGDITEFHVMDVGVDRAPGTPEDKVYSLHPVGLSVGLMPAYELAHGLWSNPRLGAALAIAACAAAIVPLLYLWLCHLGFAHGLSIVIGLACASTAPLLLFSTQIYPELPTVVIALVVLLRLDPGLWKSTGLPSAPAQIGARTPWELGVLGLLLGTLPFLHPRYAPLAGLLGLGLLWQARGRRPCQLVVIVAGLVGVIALVAHNYTFSEDWLGHFRPGNAWDENAIDVSTWWMSLPGHWLHLGKGLALNSPWYFVAAVTGAGVLALQRDRRLLLAAALYGSTAVVNGVHPDWTFGFCLPTRFVATALPALALCAAAGVDVIRRSPWLGVLFCGALAVSWDTVGVAIKVPELAFQGEHLPRATINQFYPLSAHGFLHTLDAVPLPDVLVWGLAAVTLVVLALPVDRPRLHRLVRPGITALALAGPALWGLSGDAGRLRAQLSPYLSMLVDGEITGVATLNSTFRKVSEGERLQDGTFVAGAGAPGGTLAAYFMPIQVPGVYRIVTEDVVASNAPESIIPTAGDQTTGSTQTAFVSHQRVLPALQPWGQRLRFPIQVGPDSTFRFDYYLDRLQLGYMHFVYSGAGQLTIGPSRQDMHARVLPLRLEEAARFDVRDTPGPYATRDHFSPGSYVARFQLSGGALSTLTQRQPVPVKMAVVVTDGTPMSFEQLQPWFDSRRRLQDVIGTPEAVQPQREALAAPWWSSVPLIGDDMYSLQFLVRQAGLVWILFQYDGSTDLKLEQIVVYRQHLDMEN